MRAAAGWADWQGAKIARFGDNMREVAVTEGDKVEAQLRFGYSVNGYGIGDLVEYVNGISDAEINELLDEYEELYTLDKEVQKGGSKRNSLVDAARIELGMKAFLLDGGFTGFTTTFENLHGLKQLPGLAVQRLMAQGYGFGAEGDWKTAALVRAMKVMAEGLEGGTSFMEDYTYHLEPGNMKILGAHMLEVCPSIANGKPNLEVHPLGIGGKEDPPRLVFDTVTGPAIAVSIVDLGHRLRMIVNEVEVAANTKTTCCKGTLDSKAKSQGSSWCMDFGWRAHHTSFSQALTVEHLEAFAEMADMEFLLIGENTDLSQFKKEIRWNAAYYDQPGKRF